LDPLDRTLYENNMNLKHTTFIIFKTEVMTRKSIAEGGNEFAGQFELDAVKRSFIEFTCLEGKRARDPSLWESHGI
jgi:hypothetical protein